MLYCWPRRGAGQSVPDGLSLAEEARWLTEQAFLIGDVNVVGLDEARGRNELSLWLCRLGAALTRRLHSPWKTHGRRTQPPVGRRRTTSSRP